MLFNSYLNDPERTINMFAIINNQIYLKTGDLARYNARGELVHAGRLDFQIKIRGQRVEATEIEDTIVQYSPRKISSCLVTKIPETDDTLIAYIISSDLELDIEEVRHYCNKHLRQYMVPSYFIVLDKFPLNSNAKIDRKRLPLPKSAIQIEDQSMSELEKRIHSVWCTTFRLNNISRHVNCFSLGGSSLSLMQLFNYYQFHLVPEKQLNVLDFFVNPTIAEHVRLLTNSKSKLRSVWNPLHLDQGTLASLHRL